MKNLCFLFGFLFAFSSCEKADVAPNTFSDPVFFLKGAINDAPFEIFAGGENYLIADFENYVFFENAGDVANLIGHFGQFRHFDLCAENCKENFEIIIMSHDFDVTPNNTSVDSTFSVGTYTYDFLEDRPATVSRPSSVRIQYTDPSGDTYYSMNHLNPNSNEFKITNVQARNDIDDVRNTGLSQNYYGSAELHLKFDCNLYNDNGDLLELRNMEGVMLLGSFFVL